MKSPQTCLCKNCWLSLETFHDFYRFVESNYNATVVDTKEEKFLVSNVSDLIVYEEEERNIVEHEMIKVEVVNEADYETEWIEEEQEMEAADGTRKWSQEEQVIAFSMPKRTFRPQMRSRSLNAGLNGSADDQRIRETANMKCDICLELMDSLRDAKAHFKLMHGLDGYLVCCERKFRQRCRLVEHVNTHYNYSYGCRICSKTFDSKSYLTKHLACHDDNKQYVSRVHLVKKTFLMIQNFFRNARTARKASPGSSRSAITCSAFTSSTTWNQRWNVRWRTATRSLSTKRG